MNDMQTFCARIALAAAALAACGCASDPVISGTAVAAGFVSATSEVAIVFGRTVSNAVGIGTESPPPPPVVERPVPSYLK